MLGMAGLVDANAIIAKDWRPTSWPRARCGWAPVRPNWDAGDLCATNRVEHHRERLVPSDQWAGDEVRSKQVERIWQVSFGHFLERTNLRPGVTVAVCLCQDPPQAFPDKVLRGRLEPEES